MLAVASFVIETSANYAKDCGWKICLFIYDPVCGIDDYGNKRTFDNECWLRVHACEYITENWEIHDLDGACEDKQIDISLNYYNE